MRISHPCLQSSLASKCPPKPMSALKRQKSFRYTSSFFWTCSLWIFFFICRWPKKQYLMIAVYQYRLRPIVSAMLLCYGLQFIVLLPQVQAFISFVLPSTRYWKKSVLPSFHNINNMWSSVDDFSLYIRRGVSSALRIYFQWEFIKYSYLDLCCI